MITVINESKEELFDNIASAAFDYLHLSGEASVEVIFYSEEEIRRLNFQTRNIDKATDVLSYPNLQTIKPFTLNNYPLDYDKESNTVFLGSIVICEKIAELQAEEYGHSVTREKAYLFLHGLLHLLGFDHVDESDKQKMRTAEEGILSALGVSR